MSPEPHGTGQPSFMESLGLGDVQEGGSFWKPDRKETIVKILSIRAPDPASDPVAWSEKRKRFEKEYLDQKTGKPQIVPVFAIATVHVGDKEKDTRWEITSKRALLAIGDKGQQAIDDGRKPFPLHVAIREFGHGTEKDFAVRWAAEVAAEKPGQAQIPDAA